MLYSFEDNIKELPKTIPLFPLNKVLLLPRAKLPLNLFENRYLHMLDYALSNRKIIGIPILNIETPKKGTANKEIGIIPIKVLIIAAIVREEIISLILIGDINKLVKFLLHISSRKSILKLILDLKRMS